MSPIATLTSLGFSIFSRYDGSGVDRARRDLNDLSRTLESNTGGLNSFTGRLNALTTAALALGPALIPISAAATAVAGGLAAATTSAGAAAGIWGIAAKAAVGMTEGAVKASDKLREQKAILATLTPGTQAYADQLKKVREAQGELNAAMAQLSPVQQQFVRNVEALKVSWEGFIRQTSPATLGPINTIIQAIAGNLSKLVPVVNAVGVVAQRVADSFANWANNGGLDRFVNILITDGVPALNKFLTMAQNLLRVLGDGFRTFLPIGQQVLDVMVKWSASLAGWADGGGFQRFLTFVQENAPAVRGFFEALGGALRTVGTALKDMGPSALTAATAILRLIAAMPPELIQAIAYAFLALRAAMLAVNLALLIMNANPVILALSLIVIGIGAVVAAVILLVTHWDTVWNGIKTAFNATVEFLRSKLGLLVLALGPIGAIAWIAANWSTVWNAIKVVAETIWNGLKTAWQAVSSFFVTAWQAVSGALSSAWSTFWNGITSIASAIWNALQTAWNTFITALQTIWNAVSSAVSAAWSTFWTGLQAIASAIWNALQTAWQVFITALQTIWNAVSGAVQAAWQVFWNALQTVAQAVWNALQTAWQFFLNTVQAIWNTVSAAFQAAWQLFWNAIQTVAQAIWNFLQTAWNTFLTGIQNIWNTVSSALSAAWDKVWNAIKTIASDIWNGIKDAWQKLVDEIRGIWDKFTEPFKTACKDLWNGVKDTAQEIWDKIKGVVKDAVNGVIKIINGIIGAWNTVVDAVGLGDLKISTIGEVDFAVGGVVGSGGGGGGTPSMHFARGGVIPGYAPGKDTVHAMLSKGEGVLVPEAVRGLGANFVHWANHYYSHGRGGQNVNYPGYGKKGYHMPGNGYSRSYYQGGGIVLPADPGGNGVPVPIPNTGSAGPGIPGGGSGPGTVNPSSGGVQVQGGGGNTVAPARGIVDAAGGLLGVVSGMILGFIGGPVIHSIFDPLIGAIIGSTDAGIVGKFIEDNTKKIFTAVIDVLIQKDAEAHAAAMAAMQQAAMVAAISGGGGAMATGALLDTITQALALNGLPASPENIAMMTTLIMRESGGNPNAINNTDINAINGVPSQGLAQVIPPTFAAYHVAGTSNNILDPVANVAASINYILSTYGSIGAVQQANAALPPKGYRFGTRGAHKGWRWVGENGPEMVNFRGGESVHRHGENPFEGSGETKVTFEEGCFQFNIGPGTSAEEFTRAAKNDLVPAIRMAVEAGVGKRRR